MSKVLTQKFFSRPTLDVAEDLLGKFLVREIHGKKIEAMITEVEAYDGFDDRASHASRGITPRNAPMFGQPGYWYVYFVYGMHHMLNIVTREEKFPAAVLVRSVAGVSGPGRVTKYFHINRALNNTPAARKSGLWIEERGIAIPKNEIAKTGRVGVKYAGEEWAGKPWRFVYVTPPL